MSSSRTPGLRIPVHLQAGEWQRQRVQIVNWLVEKGEVVETGDVLVEVGLPGILGDVRASQSGVVHEICHTEGEWVDATTVLGWLMAEADDSAGESA